MNSPTSPTLRDLYEAARALPPAQRDAYLEARCEEEPTRDRIRRMLAVHAAALDSMPATPADVLARALGDADEASAGITIGTQMGPFTLSRVLGEGGSSTVFCAERDIDGVRQTVALKILHRSLHSPEARRQFRRERQALTQLQHPGIARLIEGGISATGTAYIALELVDGQPITQYALDRKLDLRGRLHLFLQVCRAVEAAHRALIVHRDLKPSNVLVTGEGTVKLLDFGIAKLLVTEEETLTRLPSFTPAYAAPEQHSGAAVTTATDVYALGVLLGELLTGKRLNDGSGRAPSGRLTDVVSGDITRRALRGDLDNIVLKAMSVEADRRYVSAGALADDIERFLSGRPVVAHPPSPSYRASKFVRRHAAAVATVSVLLVGILVSLGAAVWEARDARLEAKHARTEAAKAKQTAAFLGAMLTGIDPDRAKTMDRSLIRLMLDSAANNAARSLSEAPEVRASIEQSIGDAYYSIGEFELADKHIVAALQAANAAHLDLAVQVRLTARRLDALNQFGDYEQASKLAEQLKDAIKALPDNDPDRLYAETSIGIHECALFRREPCRERLTRVYDIARRTFGEDSPFALHAAAGIVVSDFAPEHYAEGKALAQDLYARYTVMYGAEDSRTLEMVKAIAIDDVNLREFADAERVLADNLPRARRAFGEQHPLTVNLTFWFGDVLRREGRLAEAKPLLEHALEMYRRVKGENSFDTLSAETALATTLANLHDDAAAEPLARDLAGRMKTMPHGDHGVAASMLAAILIDEKRYAEAEHELDAAYAAFTQARHHSEDEPTDIVRGYVDLYTAWRKPDLLQRWRARLPARLNAD